MAFENVGSTIPGLKAAADYTSSQYLAVKIDSSGDAVLAGAGESIAGILQNKPNTGQAATVWGVGSVSKMVAGGTVAAGNEVTPDAAAKGVAATTGDFIIGYALTGAATDEVFSVFIAQPGVSA